MNGTAPSAARRLDEYELDSNTLSELASLLCDDEGPCYRTGTRLETLLRNAGWSEAEEYDRGPRRLWLLRQLMEHQNQPALTAALILRLADSREYLGDPQAHRETVAQLNDLLAHDGFRIRVAHGRGEAVDARAADGPEREAPQQLATSVTAIVEEPRAAQALQRRLEETIACQEEGAHLSAIIMMGSLLEGVLIEVLQQRGTPPPRGEKTPLQDLIRLAHEHGYIRDDVEQFSHVLRGYRNLVHVHKQIELGYAPDANTTRVCWWVVVAALNHLAASAPTPAPLPRAGAS